MEPQNNVHFAKSFIIIIAVFIAGGVIGVATDPYLPSALSNTKKGYDIGFAAARKVVEDSTLGNFFKTPDDVRSLSGKVISVSGGSLVIRLSSVNPFDDQSLNDRTVLVSADTKIMRNAAKDPKVFQAELASFIKTYRPSATSTTNGVTAPQPYTQIVIDISSIKTGDSVLVKTLENVKAMSEFTASEIQIEPAMFAK